MARHQPAWVNWSQYLALRGVSTFSQCFDEEQHLVTARAVGSLFYRFNRTRRGRADQNIATSFPHWSPQQVAAIAEQSMQHMFELFMVDSLVMTRKVTPGSWPRHITLHESTSDLVRRLVDGEPMLLLTGHCGNWELLGHYIAMMGYPLTALARPLDNPLINDWLLNIRQRRGLTILTKWGATPVLQQLARSGGRIGFIADQNAGEQGMFVPFFHRLASSYKSIGLLAMRYRMPIIAGMAARLGHHFRYQMHEFDIIEPHEWDAQDDPLFYITARFNYAIERMIRAYPWQYLWLHRRWKSRPKHELQGQEMPERFIEKLRALPWMTEDDLARLIDNSNRAAHQHAQR